MQFHKKIQNFVQRIAHFFKLYALIFRQNYNSVG